MDFDNMCFDEAPDETKLAHSGDANSSAMMPPTPCVQVVQQVSAPKRRRIGRKTSEACLPERILGDDEIKAAFASFLDSGVAATAGAENM